LALEEAQKHEDDTSRRTGPLLPEPTPTTPRKSRGGPDFHKPGCGCIACRARRRKAEALAGPTRSDTSLEDYAQAVVNTPAEEVLDADLPVHVFRDKTPRARVAQWMAIKAQNPKLNNREISEEMGIAYSTLKSILSRANKAGWLVFDDPLSRIEHEIIPQALDNVAYWLAKKDKSVTIETVKNTVYRQYLDSKGISETPNNVIALKIEMPPTLSGPVNSLPIITGQIVGKPRLPEGES
jgi:hypothetical protein